MNYLNQAVSALNSGIDAVVKYIGENGTVMAILLAVAFFIRSQIKKNPMFVEAAGGGHVLAQGTIAAQNATTREEELRKVRLRQQELATERALEAAKLKAEKDAQERQRKNNVAKKASQGGNKLGGGTTTTTTSGSTSSGQGPQGYNPMQPWTGHSSGYRPARRTVNRG